MKRTRILWLAAADARGHLMRALVMKKLALSAGIHIDILTTSDAGVRFLRTLGTSAELLSNGYAIEFDDHQNMSRLRTDARVLQYLLRPRGMRRDLSRIAELAEGAAFVVNDFHPALLLEEPERLRVVHVYGEHLWQAIEAHFSDRGPRRLDHFYRRRMCALRDRAFARIEHALIPPEKRHLAYRSGVAVHRLPAMVPPVTRTRAKVRFDLGLAPEERLAAVYLNPHFRDPQIARAIEEVLARHRFRMHAVAEGYDGREGWTAYDPRLGEAIAASDVFLSAPGMGALGQAFVHARPMIALSSDQPEQAQNLARYRTRSGLVVEEARLEPLTDLADRLDAALKAAMLRARAEDASSDRVARVHAAWLETIVELSAHERMIDHAKTQHSFGAGDQQHSRW